MTKYSCNLHDVIIERTFLNKGPYFPNDVTRFALDIIRGLEYLHKNSILHRDLKTDNIFVSLNERKLISFLSIGDFDTAKIITRRAGAKTVIGTPSYMAPEVFQSNAKNAGYTFKADIFSYGMVLYEILTLLRPYEGCSNFDIPDYIIHHKFPELPEKIKSRPDYAELIDIHKSCLHPDPDKRPDCNHIKCAILDVKKY